MKLSVNKTEDYGGQFHGLILSGLIAMGIPWQQLGSQRPV